MTSPARRPRWMRAWLLPCLLLLSSSWVSAQTNPCDSAPPTSGTATVGQTVTVTFCSLLQDQATPPNTVTVTANALYDNGTKLATQPTFTMGTQSTVSGKWPFTATWVVPSAGVHSLTATQSDSTGEGPQSTPFVLTAKPAQTVPAAPTWLSAHP